MADTFAYMEQKMTPQQAWEDFYAWVRRPENWAAVSRSGRDQIGKAQRCYTTGRPSHLGDARIEVLLSAFAPERYRFEKEVAVWVVGE